MPRAGSTLVEQILASHSLIEGTMELMTLPNLERSIRLAGGKRFDKDYPLYRYFLTAKQWEFLLGGASAQIETLGNLIAE